uniref:Uncharacterized protein n=1 Tax=Candidatus Kentrum eta TaxID=2126337 RepID=A0A450UFG7_9GAMM|nr:MAG: hypothetical protein BECKH772A_GA0070896_100138 [Candidatus Kentron sp. H]VFJ91234.1 MAG: hypothetical protein BECKH772B_GA0070898_1001518 [Candidatus Kentron sp. H]VFJ97691.1 MAG: hypothetical protein BECKH772C_GA0070978_100157 [Candidatus Kentron sp. H]
MTTKFPREEAKILELAKKMTDGLAANTDLFPAPPFPAEDIQATLEKCQAAVDAVDYDDDKLNRIGWTGRHAAVPLGVPGQVRSLHVRAQGEGWLALHWKGTGRRRQGRHLPDPAPGTPCRRLDPHRDSHGNRGPDRRPGTRVAVRVLHRRRQQGR